MVDGFASPRMVGGIAVRRIRDGSSLGVAVKSGPDGGSGRSLCTVTDGSGPRLDSRVCRGMLGDANHPFLAVGAGFRALSRQCSSHHTAPNSRNAVNTPQSQTRWRSGVSSVGPGKLGL